MMTYHLLTVKKELQETKKKVNEIQQNAINREREIRKRCFK